MNTSTYTSVVAPFKHPSTILLAGPTGSGKTEFLVQLLRCRGLQEFPERIVWIYSEWQKAYDKILALKLRNTEVKFVKDYDDSLYDTLDPKVRNLVVLDDQMENNEMHRGGTGLAKFFTQGSHHRNLTVIYIVQNMFHQSKSMRTISLNSHYLVLFKNPRDKLQIRNLAMQMYPNDALFLTSAYEDATSKPYGYLVVDLRPETNEEWRVRSDFYNPSGQCVYVPSTE